MDPLLSINPIDGRYAKKTQPLQEIFSEFGLMRNRVSFEIEYLVMILKLDKQIKFASHDLRKIVESDLRKIAEDFTVDEARKIKEHEKITKHDVKAVEYYLKDKLVEIGLEKYKELVHIGLTSQDVNSSAYIQQIKQYITRIFIPKMQLIYETLLKMAVSHKGTAMLAYTHGQAAVPTTFGKELCVFLDRISKQLTTLSKVEYYTKIGGAVGNYNAHMLAYPDVDWHIEFSTLAMSMQLVRNPVTTQIDHYDDYAVIFQNVIRIQTILLDFCRDMWTYISMNYLKLKIDPNSCGSSVMCQKVNPIDFENAEGNIGLSNVLLEHLSVKLPVSRLQRDLTDSTVLRNVGTAFGYGLIAIESIIAGLGKIDVNSQKMVEDLNNNWGVLSEGIQTLLRKHGYPNPYEALKELTRTGEKITKEIIQYFIRSLDFTSYNIDESVRDTLLNMTPLNYLGMCQYIYI